MTLAGRGFPIVLIHGFPQTAYEWRHVTALLSPRFRVVAPDLRGMGDSARATTGQDKRTLANDVCGILDRLDIDRAVVVGHDWGGAVAQRILLDHPERVARFVVIDMVYMPLFDPSWLLDHHQLLTSWYIFLHQQPDLPERLVERAGDVYLRWFLEHGSGRGGSAFGEDDVREYLRTFMEPGRATAAFNLYRTMFTVDADDWQHDASRWFDLPTLWIHGTADPFIPPQALDVLPRAFTNLRVERFEGIGHWVPEEAPDRTAASIGDFLGDL